MQWLFLVFMAAFTRENPVYSTKCLLAKYMGGSRNLERGVQNIPLVLQGGCSPCPSPPLHRQTGPWQFLAHLPLPLPSLFPLSHSPSGVASGCKNRGPACCCCPQLTWVWSSPMTAPALLLLRAARSRSAGYWVWLGAVVGGSSFPAPVSGPQGHIGVVREQKHLEACCCCCLHLPSGMEETSKPLLQLQLGAMGSGRTWCMVLAPQPSTAFPPLAWGLRLKGAAVQRAREGQGNLHQWAIPTLPFRSSCPLPIPWVSPTVLGQRLEVGITL